MNQFVESMKRLYADGKVNEKKLEELRRNEKITDEELNYILDAH